MPTVVDFETHPIINGSGHAPKPVGVSIWQLGREQFASDYFSFGHPGNNSCQEYFAKSALARVWDDELIFHNAKFDISVAMEHWGFPYPKKFHCTQVLLYLNEPLAASLGLKPSAHRLLKMPPEEQDAVVNWLVANQVALMQAHPEIKRYLLEHTENKSITANNAGAFIGYAPAAIVGPYANGDTFRTGKLWEYLYPLIQQRNMERAYDRERKIIRIGMELEQCGVRVDRPALQRDLEKYTKLYEQAGMTIRQFLGDIDIDKPMEVARALEGSPHAGPLARTPTGRLSTAKDSLIGAVTNRELLQALRYRSTLKTLIGTFFKGWLKFSAKDGYVHPVWHQTRNAQGYGTRTGRFSCADPNLTNIPTEFGEDENDVLYGLDLPYMRKYILPDEGKVIVPADYNGQEMRILAHYAEGRAMEIYQEDPKADFHQVAQRLVLETSGLNLKRKQTKITGFSLIYGSGVPHLAAQLGVSRQEGYTIKDAYLDAIPGLRDFQDSFNYRNQVRTWGGRILPVEEPKMFQGSLWTFNYKLCNYLIQGSAADQTKEACIRYDESRVEGDLLFTVHDEVVIQVEEEHLHKEVPILKEAMEKQPGWDVPFLAEVEWGHNYHDLEKYNEPTN